MKNVTPIKNDAQHKEALHRIDELMDAAAGSPQANELEVLATLVEAYESQRWPIAAPTAIEAIKFRMEQAKLAPKDLIPYIGSRSKVSEVLSGKRPLNLRMARALHRELGIPAAALLHDGSSLDQDSDELELDKLPVREMAKRGWFEDFEGTPAEAVKRARVLIEQFFARVPMDKQVLSLNRQRVRTGSKMDKYALLAWKIRLLQLAKKRPAAAYNAKALNNQFFQRLIGLSLLDNGPQLASEFLAKHGIVLIILKHLPKTHLDGAAMIAPWGNPVIGMTLRHDRLDNFWFTLLHEVAHVLLHLKSDQDAVFICDLDAEGDALEAQADEHARDTLIPIDAWRRFSAKGTYSFMEAQSLAAQLQIHPAIVAGRMRWERGNYKMLSSLVGHGRARGQFKNFVGSVHEEAA